jgi:hypothetical protein
MVSEVARRDEVTLDDTQPPQPAAPDRMERRFIVAVALVELTWIGALVYLLVHFAV